MPLQNRVTPFSQIVATPMRGLFMGNRGCLHDEKRTLGDRRWRGKRWIICSLVPRAGPRRLMAPGRYTELFFLDEAVALAAGHRPCAECRREAFRRFRAAWCRGGQRETLPSASEIDLELHAARLTAGRDQRTIRSPVGDLPDGTFIQRDEEAWLLHEDRILRCGVDGYDRVEPLPDRLEEVVVLTPAATLSALRAGYRPVLHPSAASRHPPW
ncbi:hypothetical protein ASG43_19955 [Aureimonas sp. Leaf454]|uniref:hypothetical protein n=1 Tax=Aureimonas sp. Leaf454 TaxID=1736381 RepID=UPI0006F9B7CE|nr:hypothetical protein [Aureimonas sp. Leaf454]KQT52736.1 hypothetical protein ASG43_19955 [Aureimonas sp. Leaf454]